MTQQWLSADLVWTGHDFERDAVLGIENGSIIDILASGERVADRRLSGQALIPGFVNAHSHAFQRGLRGHGETFSSGAGSFWSWRQAMYRLVQTSDADGFSTLCRRAFGEMLDAGITTVGEFHYFHHLGQAGSQDFDADRLVLEAAADIGIRMVLLQAHYVSSGVASGQGTSGSGLPLEAGQRRFDTRSLDDYRRRIDQLSELLGPEQSLGVVAHSVRAVPIDQLVELHRLSLARDMVFHMHLEEQRQEIEQCVAAHGLGPLALINQRLETDARTTAVHCTHSQPDDLERYLATGANVCLCPLTEANLGDGIADLPAMDRAISDSPQLCLGSDSNLRISMLDEMRWLEYGQRLRTESRGVLVDADGRVSRRLLDAATLGGARSLGLAAGRLATGHVADMVAIDLSHPSLATSDGDAVDAEDADLLDMLIFGAPDSAISGVCVGGKWLR